MPDTHAVTIALDDAELPRDDAFFLDLFRQWRAAEAAFDALPNDDDDSAAAAKALNDAEERIYLTPAAGPGGMAIKIAVNAYHEPGLTRPFDESHYAPRHNYSTGVYDGPPALHNEMRCLRGLLRDAAHFVPELADFVAAAAQSPLELPADDFRDDRPAAEDHEQVPSREAEIRRRAEALAAACREALPPGDAGLIEAERRLVEFEQRRSKLSRDFKITMAEEKNILPIFDAASDLLCDFLFDEPPQGLVGVTAKLRYLTRNPDAAGAELFAELLDVVELTTLPGRCGAIRGAAE